MPGHVLDDDHSINSDDELMAVDAAMIAKDEITEEDIVCARHSHLSL